MTKLSISLKREGQEIALVFVRHERHDEHNSNTYSVQAMTGDYFVKVNALQRVLPGMPDDISDTDLAACALYIIGEPIHAEDSSTDLARGLRGVGDSVSEEAQHPDGDH